jgi:hypothetical protein
MTSIFVMAGLDPAIHEPSHGRWAEGVDARVKPGHDGVFGAGEW